MLICDRCEKRTPARMSITVREKDITTLDREGEGFTVRTADLCKHCSDILKRSIDKILQGEELK